MHTKRWGAAQYCCTRTTIVNWGPQQLTKLTQEKQDVENRLADSAIYEVEQRETLQALLISQGENQKQLDAIEEQWLDVQEKLEALPEIE